MSDMPQPNWDDEQWANYWAVDANGREVWFTIEPYCDDDEGACWCGRFDTDGKHDPGIYGKKVKLPIGVDWRTTLRQRPTSPAQDGQEGAK